MPIPHSAARASPVTEVLHASPALNIAAATVVPGATETAAPFKKTVIQPSRMRCLLLRKPLRQIWFYLDA
jgi:hypothetical protein